MNGIARKIPGAHGLILDLRKNGGGDAEAMAELAALFLDSGFNLGTFTDRNGVSFQLSVPKKSTLAAAPLVHTNLPMIVLTDERTSSAAEILAASLQAAGRAKIIGSDTCRCVLAIRSRHTLPDGGVLDVSEFDYRTGNGVRLEGRGIKPDEPIALSRNDLYNHRDAALEAALQLLIKKFNR
jgi:carboxyl-terminal processing protease